MNSKGRWLNRRPFVCSSVAAWALCLLTAALPQDAQAGPTVALVASDDAALPQPIARDQRLDYHQHIRPMVYRVLDQSGLRDLVLAAEAGEDGIVDVVCKVNIVHAHHVQGDVTDWRVVKAVFQAVHQWRPDARLTVAEGGVWFPPERTDLHALQPDVEIGDGFETAGYRALLNDPDLAGANLRIVDLNYDDTIEKIPPGGGLIAEAYHVPVTIDAAEVLIDVPVMKITGAIGMTVATKNLIGIAPGLKYGWSKSRGWPPDSGNPGIWHTARTLDETIVDLAGVAEVDFVVVDAIMCMERGRILADGGMPTRRNIVFATPDLIAADAVATRLMGMNPLDMEYLQLGQQRGLGIADISRLNLIGDLEELTDRFHKYPLDWGDGHYGMSQRTWLLKGPISADDETHPIDPGSKPRPDEDGWTGPVYFYEDRIDLDRYFNDPIHSHVWAYAEFDAPRDEMAELWVGSDEGLTIWIDGVEVYSYAGRRRHQLPNERVQVRLTQGPHRVMVRARQRRGDFDFSVKLCEVESDPRYDGNHVFGLTWNVPGEATHEVSEVYVIGDNRQDRVEWYEEHEVDTTSPNRVYIKSILPWDGQASWIRLEWPRMWGNEMEMQAIVTPDRIEIMTDNVQAFRLEPAGPLEQPLTSVELVVDDQRLGTLPHGYWRLAADDAGVWALSPSATIDWDELGFIGTASDHLGRDPAPGERDTPLGNWFTDAALAATGADVAIQNKGGVRGDLEVGAISIRDIFSINFPNDLYAFTLTGRELLEVLEYDYKDSGLRQLQVAGITFTIDRSRPEGQRVVESNIDLDHSYTIVSQAYVCNRSQRFFGREIETTNSQIQTVDGQIRRVLDQGTVEAPATGRIRELNVGP
ncbi:MAG: DUF362 domain-containing protein [Gemmatimonadetes bacterium]|nr:DUF362 domain-containing protein [Gemmatimonadota bacterium]